MESGREGGVHAVCQALAELLIVFFFIIMKDNQLTYLMVNIAVHVVSPATQDKHESNHLEPS